MSDKNLSNLDKLAEYVSCFIKEQADSLVAEWIDWLKSRLDTHTVNSLPDQALRNHIPPVIVAISRYVQTPLEMLRSEILGHLDLHGRIRWEQGYEIEEILAEFEGLATIVMKRVMDELSNYKGDTTSNDAIEVFNRLSTGLRSIGYITVGIYRDTEKTYDKQTSSKLEEFARSIAHEIRTPLQAISLTTSLLFDNSDKKSQAKKDEYIKIIHESVERANDLLANLHILAMLEGTNISSNKITLRDAIQNVMDELNEIANAKDVVLSINDDIPNVKTFSTPVHIALVNFISNSIKYSDPNKDKPKCEVSVKIITKNDQLNLCEISIEDNGLGIPKDLIETVFNRNTRAHPEVAPGTGLGLSISRDVIMKSGGEVKLDSVQGKGTQVTFTLPVIDNLPSKQSNTITSTDLARLSIESLFDKELEGKHSD